MHIYDILVYVSNVQFDLHIVGVEEMTIDPIENLFYFIKGAFNICVNNWVLSIPIAMTIIYWASRLFVYIRRTLKGEK